MHSNNPLSIQISKYMFSSFKAARNKCENNIEEENKRKMTSERESRKTVINKEIIFVTNTITG